MKLRALEKALLRMQEMKSEAIFQKTVIVLLDGIDTILNVNDEKEMLRGFLEHYKVHKSILIRTSLVPTVLSFVFLRCEIARNCAPFFSEGFSLLSRMRELA